MKKTTRNLFVTCFLMAFLSFVFQPSNAAASGLTQSNPSINSITVNWEPESRATGYKVYIRDGVQDTLYTSLPAGSTSVTITNLPASTEKNIVVKYLQPSSSGNQIYELTLSSGMFKTLPGKVTNVHQKRWYYHINIVDVSWNRQDSVDGYEYKIAKSNGKKVASKTINGSYTNYFSQNKVSNSMVYTVRVRAFSTICGQKKYGAWSDKCYCFTQPQLKTAKVSNNRLTVKWNKVSGATGYEIYVSQKPTKGYKKVKTVGKKVTSATIAKFKGKKFSSKKTYYVYVKTIKKVGKKKYDSGKLYYWNTKTNASGYFQS